MALNHTHKVFDNFVLANEIEDQYLSKLDLNGFVTVDNELVGVAGDKKLVRTYDATSATERLVMGEGNTKNIEVTYSEKEHTIQLAQTRFPYYDEEAMKDPMLLATGVERIAADMYQCVQDDIYACFTGELNTNSVAATGDWFGDLVDAVSMLTNYEQPEGIPLFAFVNRKDMAALRKSMRDEFKYIEAFARAGYVGTIAGVNFYVKADALQGTVVGGTSKAVTVFNKRGIELESDRDANIRLNKEYARKYYMAALTDARECFKIVKAQG